MLSNANGRRLTAANEKLSIQSMVFPKHVFNGQPPHRLCREFLLVGWQASSVAASGDDRQPPHCGVLSIDHLTHAVELNTTSPRCCGYAF